MNKKNQTNFQLRIVILLVLILSVAVYFLSTSINNLSKDKDKLENDRLISLQLVDELRQSSDDLTQMSRLYVISGDSTYYNYFNKIISIREGKSPRPIDYNQVYWDLILADGKKPRPDGNKTSILKLIQEYCPDNEVLKYFNLAKINSDDLIEIEKEAFNAKAGVFKDSLGNYSIKGAPNKSLAISLLHSEQYFKGKSKIMNSINDFYYSVDNYFKEKNLIINEKQEQRKLIQFIVTILLIIKIVVLIIIVSRKRNRDNNHSDVSTIKSILNEIKNSWSLILVVIVFSLGVFLFFNYVVKTVEKNIKNDIENSLSTVLESTKENINSWLSDIEFNLSSFLNEEELKVFFKKNSLKNKSDLARLKNEIDIHFSDNSFEGYMLIDENDSLINTNVVDLLNLDGDDYPKQGYFGALKASSSIVSKFPSNESGNETYNHLIKIGSAIYSENNEYLGAIILFLNPQERFTKVLQTGRIGESGESYAFNDKGQMISESRFTNQLQEMGLLKEDEKSELNIEIRDPEGEFLNKNKTAFTLMANTALSGNAGVNAEGYNDYRGVMVVGVWDWIDKYNFGVTTEIDYDEAFKTLFLIEKLSSYSILFFILLMVILLIVFIINRSKLSELNRAISNQSDLIRSIIDAIPDIVFYKDTELKFLGANKAFLKQVGLSEDKIIGRKDDEFIRKELSEKFAPMDQIIINEKKSISIESEDVDSEGNKIVFDTIKTPFYNSKGKLLGLIGVSRDITERKEIEEKIKVSENRFRSIASTATDAIIAVDNLGRIELWNKSAEVIFGYSNNEMLGKSLKKIIPEKYRDAHNKGMSRVLDGGGQRAIGRTLELEGLRKDGSIFPLEMSLSKWDGHNGMHFSAILRDITERKQMEAILVEANKRMEGELNVAKEIQMSMLPLIFPAFPKRNEIDIHAILIPAREVGGDFYDFHFLDESRIYLVVGDVSGKGVPAALMMAVTKTLLKSRANLDSSPASILTHVNNEIAKDNEACMFITVFLGILDLTSGELVYSNAGHNPSFIIGENRALKSLSDLHGPVIGAMEDMTYSESSVTIKKDDILFAYTDGVTESQNKEGNFFTNKKLEDILESKSYNTVKELTELVIDKVKDFEKGAEQFDDITVLTLQYLFEKTNIRSSSTSIRIKNKLKEIANVIEKFESFAEENKINFVNIQKFNVVLDEILNNIISYGFEDNESHNIDIEFNIKNLKLIINIIDGGIPFNPFRNDPPDTMLTLDERNIGGLGIHLVKNLVDEYEYQRQTDKNIIKLIKYNINIK